MQKLVEIPKLFYSDLTSLPFDKCDVCTLPIEELEVPYRIEKGFKSYEENLGNSTLFEIVICENCELDLKASFSEKSLNTVKDIFEEALENERPNLEQYTHELDFNFWINRCIITDIPKHLLSEYQLIANFKGDKMILSDSPYIVSMEAVDSIYEILSEDTKIVLSDFSKQYIKVPLELKSFFTNGFPKLII